MSDLIKQIEHAAAGSITDEVRLLKQKRKTLDDVIKFTLSINHLQKSLEAVLLLKQPASSIPRDLLNILGNISNSIANLPSTELSKRLIRIEETIKKDIDTIMGISDKIEMLDPDAKVQPSAELDSDDCHSLLSDFRRRTNTAIILKLHLRKRGVAVTESVIPVTTDALVSQVSKLVSEEKKCTQRTIKELQALDLQIGKIIGNKDYSEELKKYALLMRQQINRNIEHLEQGKDIEKMPFAVEIIELSSGSDQQQEQAFPDETASDPEIAVKEINQGKTDEHARKTKKPGFIKKLFKWLSSPWSVKWRDIN